MTTAIFIISPLIAAYVAVGLFTGAIHSLRVHEYENFPTVSSQYKDYSRTKAAALVFFWLPILMRSALEGYREIEQDLEDRRLQRFREERKRLDEEIRRLEDDQ